MLCYTLVLHLYQTLATNVTTFLHLLQWFRDTQCWNYGTLHGRQLKVRLPRNQQRRREFWMECKASLRKVMETAVFLCIVQVVSQRDIWLLTNKPTKKVLCCEEAAGNGNHHNCCGGRAIRQALRCLLKLTVLLASFPAAFVSNSAVLQRYSRISLIEVTCYPGHIISDISHFLFACDEPCFFRLMWPMMKLKRRFRAKIKRKQLWRHHTLCLVPECLNAFLSNWLPTSKTAFIDVYTVVSQDLM